MLQSRLLLLQLAVAQWMKFHGKKEKKKAVVKREGSKKKRGGDPRRIDNGSRCSEKISALYSHN